MVIIDFRISHVIQREGEPSLYEIEDLKGDSEKQKFYSAELIAAPDPATISFQIEKVLKREKRQGVQMALVRWSGYSPKFDTWESQESIVTEDD
jgi:hypothetical protein